MKTNKRIKTWIDKSIEYGFYALFFSVPLYFSVSHIYNAFEFNKLLLIYGFSAFIGTAWIVRILIHQELLWRQTPLDIPILLFISALILSTFFSTYVPVSVWGKSAMPQGALMPTIALVFLFFAFVNHMQDKNKLLTCIYIITTAGLFNAIYGIFQYYGHDFIEYSEQFKSRSVGTIGQANGLAAFLGGLLPLIFFLLVRSENIFAKLSWGIVFSLFIFCMLATASRSGLLGGIIGLSIFILCLVLYSLKIKAIQKAVFSVLFMVFFGGASILIFFAHSTLPLLENQKTANVLSNALQEGSLQSAAEVRFLVWQGALDIWKKYPLVGSGPETFDFQYDLVRSKEHNLLSSWNLNFVKAHNEYLQFLATTGILGLGTHLLLIGIFIGWLIYAGYKLLTQDSIITEEILLPFAILAGYIDLLITNIFGFSFATTALLLYLFPAMAIVGVRTIAFKRQSTTQPPHWILARDKTYSFKIRSFTRKIGIGAALIFIILVLVLESIVWYADLQYQKGKQLIDRASFEAEKFLQRAVALNPFPAHYHMDLAAAYSLNSLTLKKTYGDIPQVTTYKNQALEQLEVGLKGNPPNLSFYQEKFKILYNLFQVDPSLYNQLYMTIQEQISRAPTNPTTYFKLGILEDTVGRKEQAITALKKSIDLKPDYYDSLYVITLFYFEYQQLVEAHKALTILLDFLSHYPIDRNQQYQDLQRLAEVAKNVGAPKDAKSIYQYLLSFVGDSTLFQKDTLNPYQSSLEMIK